MLYNLTLCLFLALKLVKELASIQSMTFSREQHYNNLTSKYINYEIVPQYSIYDSFPVYFNSSPSSTASSQRTYRNRDENRFD